MDRARVAFAATVAVGLMVGSMPAAQNVQPPPMRAVLAGKSFVPPAQGQVTVEYLQPAIKRQKDLVVTSIQVKNIGEAPIARLTIDEIWYAPDGSVSNRGRGVVNGLLQPNEVRTIVIETPYNSRMSSNNWNFSHANGTVDPKRVQKMEAPEPPAGEPAAATKKP